MNDTPNHEARIKREGHAAIEAAVAAALTTLLIPSLPDRAVQAAYTSAIASARLSDPVAQAIRIECRAVAQRRGLDLVRGV